MILYFKKLKINEAGGGYLERLKQYLLKTSFGIVFDQKGRILHLIFCKNSIDFLRFCSAHFQMYFWLKTEKSNRKSKL